jgi:hypothetical protein
MLDWLGELDFVRWAKIHAASMDEFLRGVVLAKNRDHVQILLCEKIRLGKSLGETCCCFARVI